MHQNQTSVVPELDPMLFNIRTTILCISCLYRTMVMANIGNRGKKLMDKKQ